MNNTPLAIMSHSVAETINLGKQISKHLQGGEVIALTGNLGAGKTHMIKGIATGLGIDPNDVNSPTFTLINEYEGRLPLQHIDAYRFDNPNQLSVLGFDEIATPPNVVIVEWANIVHELLKDFNPIEITITHTGETTRQIILNNMPFTL
jgi:tRNA threonylcarbamoyladenosine biosynthesis protein TsaE